MEEMSERGSVTSRSGLLSGRFSPTKKNKIIASFVLTVALISGSVGFIHMYHRSNGDLTPPEGEGQDTSSKNVFYVRSVREDKPMAITLQGLTPSLTRRSLTQGSEGRSANGNVTTTVSPSSNGVSSTARGQRRRTKGQKELPADARSLHPVTLIYEMQTEPRFTYIECKDGNTTLGFKAELRVNRKPDVFLGYGKNKKQAKRIAAGEACKAIWQFSYSFEDIPGRNEIVESCRA